MKRFAYSVLMLALVAFNALAGEVGNGDVIRNKSGSLISGAGSDGKGYIIGVLPSSLGGTALLVHEAVTPYNYSVLTGVWSGGSLTAKARDKTGVVPLPEYTSMQVHVAWTYADTTVATADSLFLELIPYSKISNSADGIEMPIDLDPTTPGVQGVYITRMQTPPPVYGLWVDSTRVNLTVGQTAATFVPFATGTTGPAKTWLAGFPNGSLWMSCDSSTASIAWTRFARVAAAGPSGMTLAAPAGQTLTGYVANFYLDPPIKVYTDNAYVALSSLAASGASKNKNQWGEGRIGSGFASFDLATKQGVWIKEAFIGFYVINHGASATSALTNISIDIWPKVN